MIKNVKIQCRCICLRLLACFEDRFDRYSIGPWWIIFFDDSTMVCVNAKHRVLANRNQSLIDKWDLEILISAFLNTFWSPIRWSKVIGSEIFPSLFIVIVKNWKKLLFIFRIDKRMFTLIVFASNQHFASERFESNRF